MSSSFILWAGGVAIVALLGFQLWRKRNNKAPRLDPLAAFERSKYMPHWEDGPPSLDAVVRTAWAKCGLAQREARGAPDCLEAQDALHKAVDSLRTLSGQLIDDCSENGIRSTAFLAQQHAENVCRAVARYNSRRAFRT